MVVNNLLLSKNDCKMKMNGSGCVFDNYGRVPETIYSPEEEGTSRIEKAVFNNQPKEILAAIEDGEQINASLRVGQMTCLEYAAMMGYEETLRLLIENSQHSSQLHAYFALGDVVERAYMISKNKSLFFGSDGVLAEANRYEAALFTAVEYNQPLCVKVMLGVLGPKEPNKHIFITDNTYENLSALELATVRGHKECADLLSQRQWQCPGSGRSSKRSQSQTERTE